METVPISGTDRLWNNCDQGPAPLTELALNEKATNSALVDCHHQLALVMYMLVTFQTKKTKPLSLFGTEVRLILSDHMRLE